MPNKKGFTLVEILVVLVITGILTAIALPGYLNFVQQGAATAAQHNLISIYNAQKNNYFTTGNYCTTTCNTLANINTNLSLTITDANFTYACSTDSSGFKCIATNISDTNLHLTLSNNPLVLPGGAGCGTISGSACNPVCSTDKSTYCPN